MQNTSEKFCILCMLLLVIYFADHFYFCLEFIILNEGKEICLHCDTATFTLEKDATTFVTTDTDLSLSEPYKKKKYKKHKKLLQEKSL